MRARLTSPVVAPVALAFATLALCGAAEKTPSLALAFKSTVVSTYPDGRKAELWLEPDGTYKAEGRRHDRTNGHWSVKGDRICLQQNGIPLFHYCTAIPSGAIGKSWPAKAVTGEPITVRLVAGRAGA